MNLIIFIQCLKKRKKFFFIQIGSNDGRTKDPIYFFVKTFDLKGVCVEPVNYLFKRLKLNYIKQKNIYFENSAISTKREKKTFFRLKENSDPDMPIWYDQLGSFSKKTILSHRNKIKNFDKYLITEKVNCITFQDLLKKYHVTTIDLLHIDVEGYDFEIIKTLSLSKIKPAMVLYEHVHLTDDDHKKCIQLLKNLGYKIFLLESDVFAYK